MLALSGPALSWYHQDRGGGQLLLSVSFIAPIFSLSHLLSPPHTLSFSLFLSLLLLSPSPPLSLPEGSEFEDELPDEEECEEQI